MGRLIKPVLYISHSKRGLFYYNDASARYRCVFPAEEIIANGGQAHAIHFSQIGKVQLDDYRKIVFHRPQYSFKLAKTIKRVQKKNIECWVDFDDLLFSPELSESSAAVQSGKMSPALAKKHAKRYLKALRLFKKIQVSTDELADQLKKQIVESKNEYQVNLDFRISYNKVPERWVKQAEIIPAEERLKKKIIRYLPGTSHHKHDFAHIEKFLAELLQANPDYHLNIIGELEFDYEKFPKGQISTTPFQPYEQLPNLINDSWIIIAPLVDNVFNRCKSGLKFWESGVFGIPVISSPLRDIERFKNNGLCISDDLNEWKKFIRTMRDKKKYIEASHSVLKICASSVIKSHNKTNKRLEYLRMTVGNGPRWPGIIINPTQDIKTTTANTEKGLLAKAKRSIEDDKEPKKNTFVRKVKKLYTSPSKFFQDSKLLKLVRIKH